jgi:hypothetical protein
MSYNIENTKKTEEYIDQIQGAYIFQDFDNKINLFIYIKLDEKELKEALPLSYNANLKDSNYLIVIIKNERDHLGQNSFESIQNLIKNKNMYNILEKNYEQLSKNIGALTQEQYDNYLGFAKRQLTLE